MIRELAICAALGIGGPALAQQQPKVSGGDTPPANPPSTQAAPADKAGATPAPASRSATARQALKALKGEDPAKPKPAPAGK